MASNEGQGSALGIVDPLGALLDFQWRSVSIPVEKTRMRVRQDLVIHKFADRDGAHVESTGRHPLEITATIPFINTLKPGPNEGWRSTPLYPTQFRAFFVACTDNTSGELQHPEFGLLTCKLSTAEFVWSADRRGGVDCEAVWLESDDTGGDLTAALSTASPLAGLTASAAQLDAQLANIAGGAPFPPPYVPPFSISDLVNQVIAATDTVTLLQRDVGGQLAGIIYQAQRVQASLDAASNSLQWPINLACEQTIESARAAQSNLLSQGKPVSVYTTGKDSTLGELATVIPASVVDLMQLNPTLMQSPIVPAATQVRFYPLTGS